jgi:hypothetical protein
MNWKECGRKLSWLEIRQEVIRKPVENLNQDGRCPGRDSNMEPSNYESDAWGNFLGLSILILTYEDILLFISNTEHHYKYNSVFHNIETLPFKLLLYTRLYYKNYLLPIS